MKDGLIYRAYSIRLKEGTRESYLDYHSNIWPEVEENLKKAGIREYRIFITPDDQLFSIIGCQDDETMERLVRMNAENPICTKWETLMSGMQTPCAFAGGTEGWFELDKAYVMSEVEEDE